MNRHIVRLAALVVILGACASAEAQIDFDRPDIIQTSYTRQAAKEQAKKLGKKIIAKASPAPIAANSSGPLIGGGDCNCNHGSVWDGYGPEGGHSATFDAAFAPVVNSPSSCGCNSGGFDIGYEAACDNCGAAIEQGPFNGGGFGGGGCKGGCGGGLFRGGGFGGRLGGGGFGGRLGGVRFSGGGFNGGGFGDCDGGCGGGGQFLDSGFSDDCCGAGYDGGRRMGLTVSGIVDIPLDGVFHTGADARISAGALGVPTGTLPAATPIDLLFNEMGFEDIYRTFGGVETNLHFQTGCNTSVFIGYRYLEGRAEDSVNVGTAIDNPLTTPTSYDINASFSDFQESRLQAGFLTSRCLRGTLDFLWGGRLGIGFVDDISLALDVQGLTTLNDVRFYDDTTNFNFDFNFGFQKRMGCHMSAHVLTGAQYRTSLNGFDQDLAVLGLEELNDGSGFVSLPIYMGFTYRR